MTKKQRNWKEHYQKHREYYLEQGKLYDQTPKGKYHKYKSSAKTRGFSFKISFEEFMSFWQIPCSYCGGGIETVGLDRVDSSKGYTLDNIVSCCSICNRMKMTMNSKDFIKHCKKVIRWVC